MSVSLTKKKALPKSFYMKDALHVAKNLLGKIFIKIENNKILAGRIVETEAYKENFDESAHSFRGKTKRNEVMFEEGGLLYVYFTYGVHFCANVVTGKKDTGDAVLLRAFEPLEGLSIMAERRYQTTEYSGKQLINLVNGPGKICQAFNLNREFNGKNLTSDELFIVDQPCVGKQQIVTTTRIGIKKSVDLPWRFYIKNNDFVSKK